MRETSSATGQRISFVVELRRAFADTDVTSASDCGSSISSAVTSAGPSGPNVSHDLPS